MEKIKKIKDIKAYKIDEHDVKEWNPIVKIAIGFMVLYLYIGFMAYPLYLAEIEAGGNVKSYNDAFWLLQMSASTIGFGDVYPVSKIGRWIVAVSFYIGVGIAGYVGATIADIFTGFTDTNIKNRELRTLLKEVKKDIDYLKAKEIKKEKKRYYDRKNS
jgi:voltage-gated potassium channel